MKIKDLNLSREKIIDSVLNRPGEVFEWSELVSELTKLGLKVTDYTRVLIEKRYCVINYKGRGLFYGTKKNINLLKRKLAKLGYYEV